LRIAIKNSFLILIIGVIFGAMLFYLVEPRLLGWRASPLIELEALMHLILRTYPFVVLPFTVLAVAFFDLQSRKECFLGAFFLSAALLLPIPLVDYWLVAPGVYGEGAHSAHILLDIVTVATILLALGVVSGGVAALVTPHLRRVFFARRNSSL